MVETFQVETQAQLINIHAVGLSQGVEILEPKMIFPYSEEDQPNF